MQKKDDLLRRIALKRDSKTEKVNSEISESENEDVKTIVSEMQRIQAVYRDELAQWETERQALIHEKEKLQEESEKMRLQLDIYETDSKAAEVGPEEIQKALAARSRECAESGVNLIIAKRKCATVEELLTKESSKTYSIQKEAIAAESTYRKIVADMDKRDKLLENRMRALESNLSNSISILEYNELKEKYDEANIRIRTFYELKLVLDSNDEVKISEDQLKTSEKSDKKEIDIKKINVINSELQKQLAQLQNFITKNLHSSGEEDKEENKISELEEAIKILRIENENLIRVLTISREEAQMHYATNSLKTLELDSLRHQILDLQAISEDKETIAKLGFELNSCKAAEIEINRKKLQLDTEIEQLRNDLSNANQKYDEARIQLEEIRRRSESQFKNYDGVIEFLQNQYVGSTPMTSLARYENILRQLTKEREEIGVKLRDAKEFGEGVKAQQETLANRLEIVDRLKDILEQQIGSPNVESIMHRFSENSQKDLSVRIWFFFFFFQSNV